MILAFDLSVILQNSVWKQSCREVSAIAKYCCCWCTSQLTSRTASSICREYYNRYDQGKYRIRSNMITYNSNLFFPLCSILFLYASKTFLIHPLRLCTANTFVATFETVRRACINLELEPCSGSVLLLSLPAIVFFHTGPSSSLQSDSEVSWCKQWALPCRQHLAGSFGLLCAICACTLQTLLRKIKVWQRDCWRLLIPAKDPGPKLSERLSFT